MAGGVGSLTQSAKRSQEALPGNGRGQKVYWEGRKGLGGPTGRPVGVERHGKCRESPKWTERITRFLWRAGRGWEEQKRLGVPPIGMGEVGEPFLKAGRGWETLPEGR